mmetsp:Transcript_3781/g.9574  ORF Transcript_3781/g.9574 Transcript_3781/m.9574 type:complete len:281 (+) Transcript_3781:213-1055(+)|eukprot:jgi/Tetstr1/459942/TSEL_005280.t1
MAGGERSPSGSPDTKQPRRRERGSPNSNKQAKDGVEAQALLRNLKQQLQMESMARRAAERERLALQKQLEGSFRVGDRGDGEGRIRRAPGDANLRGPGGPAGKGEPGNRKHEPAQRLASEAMYEELNADVGSLNRCSPAELERRLYKLKEELAEKDLCLRAERKGTTAARKFKEGAVSLIEKAQLREAEVEEIRQQLQSLLHGDRSKWAAQEKKSDQNMVLLRKEIFQLTNALYIERRSNQRLTEQLLREKKMKDHAVMLITNRAKQTASTDNPLLWFKK